MVPLLQEKKILMQAGMREKISNNYMQKEKQARAGQPAAGAGG